MGLSPTCAVLPPTAAVVLPVDRCQTVGYALNHAGFDVAGRGIEGVFDGNGMRAAVPDDDHAIHPQQWRAAVLRVVGAAADRAKRGIHEGEAGQGVGPAADSGAEFADRELGGGLHGFQDEVAGEPVTDHEVHRAIEQAGRLDVASEVERRVGQEFRGREGERAALGGFLTDAQDASARLRCPVHLAQVDRAHQAEVAQMFGPGLGVGPRVDQERWRLATWNQDRQSGSVHPLGSAHHQHAGRHGRAGVAHGHQGLGLARADQIGAAADRSVGRRAHGLHGVRPHLDGLWAGLQAPSGWVLTPACQQAAHDIEIADQDGALAG